MIFRAILLISVLLTFAGFSFAVSSAQSENSRVYEYLTALSSEDISERLGIPEEVIVSISRSGGECSIKIDSPVQTHTMERWDSDGNLLSRETVAQEELSSEQKRLLDEYMNSVQCGNPPHARR